MKRVLLTSGGLSKNLEKFFFSQVCKPANEIRVIFIPSAATHNDSARESLSLCMYHLNNMGISANNILVYHLQYLLSEKYARTYSREDMSVFPQFRLLTPEELAEFDVIIFGGGDASILLDEMNRTGFSKVVKQAVEKGLFYMGISAGSMIAAGNLPGSLGYISNAIVVHAASGMPCGEVPQEGEVILTDNQAIWIEGESIQIIE